MRLRISRAVGVNQPNNIADVKKVQMLLNRAIRDDNIESLKEDGLWGPKTFARLVYFQKQYVHLSHPDAVVNRYGPTFKRLNRTNSVAHNETSPHQRHTIVVPDSNQIKQLAQRASLPLPALNLNGLTEHCLWPLMLSVTGGADSCDYCARGSRIKLGAQS
jgi:flagellar protein FlgJ